MGTTSGTEPGDNLVAATPIIWLNKKAISLSGSGTYQLVASVQSAYASLTGAVWSSKNTAVATVDQTGKVTAVAPGTTEIKLITANGKYNTYCKVTVTGTATSFTASASRRPTTRPKQSASCCRKANVTLPLPVLRANARTTPWATSACLSTICVQEPMYGCSQTTAFLSPAVTHGLSPVPPASKYPLSTSLPVGCMAKDWYILSATSPTGGKVH